MRTKISSCPGCGVVLDEVAGPTHPYIGASAACWALYGERHLTIPHPLVVHVYAVQHPGVPERRAVQSVALHLMALCAVFQCDAPADRLIAFLQRALLRPPAWEWLEPPVPNGSLTIADVIDREIVEVWARDVWDAWSDHHAVVRAWLDAAGGAL